ncbi:hypothetical protein [Caulobacter sp. 17J80-11]|uniref:hypothetical protein n=1 Tax=Caulobacter sp. 17J80-11 TaxID=2763502 RepID=UPI0016536A7C|nr:hypothetical protein [Caulobacter sp. 17J80-11]MBC6982324.1 hypothetical protein [Caulobacter sp. 17J80-11]
MPHLPDLPQTPDLDSPEERRAFERRAAEEAMESEHQVFAGSARHVGGVEFDDPGVFEIDDPEVDPDDLIVPGEVSGGPLETGYEFRTEAEIRDRDPGDAAGSLSPDQPGVTTVVARADADLGGAPAPNVVAPQQGAAEMSAGRDDHERDRASARREWKGDRTGEPADDLYNPTEVSSTRMRQQGLGMGEEELRMQRDARREYHVREDMPGGEPPPPEPRPRRPDKRQ